MFWSVCGLFVILIDDRWWTLIVSYYDSLQEGDDTYSADDDDGEISMTSNSDVDFQNLDVTPDLTPQQPELKFNTIFHNNGKHFT